LLWAVRVLLAELEIVMPITVVLAVGLDSSLLRTQGSVWKSAGYIVSLAGSIREAIDRFRAGDFDLVLLGDSIPAENRERLTFLIRAFGSHVPVVSIANSSAACDVFADATLRSDSSELLKGMGELMAKRSSMPVAQTMAYSNAA
jgi:DNA-binding NarL/FixJ family response regulator